MGIFRRRPFMLCCFCFLASGIVGFCLDSKVKIFTILFLFLAAIIFFVLVICKRNRRITLTVIALALLFSFISMAESFIYYDIHTAKLENYIGSKHSVECTVISSKRTMSYLSGYTAKLVSLNGEKVNGYAIVQFPDDMGFDEGETVRFEADCVLLSEVTLGNSDRIGLMADGVSIAFVSEATAEDITFIEDKFLIFEGFRTVQRELSYKIQNFIGGEEGRLSAAVALGDKKGLSDETERDFARSGLSHLLSLSGMHMAVISSFFCYMLKLFYVPKKIRCYIMPLIMLIYLCLTGFSLPTFRAAFMLSAVYLSFVSGTKTDARTVLLAAGMTMIALMPYAVLDVGFWMSLASTLGLIVFYPKSLDSSDSKKKKSLKCILRSVSVKILSSLAVTVIAVLSVILLTQIFFGEMSLISPLSNIVAGPSVMLITVLSLIWILVSAIPGINTAVAFVIRLLSGFVIYIAQKCSDIKNICISFEPVYAKVIVWCFCAVMAVFMIITLKNKRIIFITPLVAAAIFVISFGVNYTLNSERADAVYIRRGESEVISLVSLDGAVMVDMTDGNYTNYIFAWNEIHKEGATELDTLVLTHYHDKHEYSVEKLMSVIKVRKLMIPEPKDKEELWCAEDLNEIAHKHGSELVIYKPETPTEILKSLSFIQYERGKLSRSVQDTLAFEIAFGSESLAYIGSSYSESLGDGINEAVKDSKCLIYGSHGPNPQMEFNTTSLKNITEAMFADKELFELARFRNGVGENIRITVDCEKYKTELRKKH